MTDRTPQEQVEVVRNRLAFLLVGAFVGALIDFTLFPVPASNKDIITYMVGQLSGMALMALGLYFTKNAGQDTLDVKRADTTGKMAEAINTALNTPAPPDPAPVPTVTLAPGEEATIAAEDRP